MSVNNDYQNKLKSNFPALLQRVLAWDRLQILSQRLPDFTLATAKLPFNSPQGSMLALALLTFWPLSIDCWAQRRPAKTNNESGKSVLAKKGTSEDPLEKAEALMKKGWVLDAIQYYQKALAKDPQNLAIRRSLAFAEEKQGRTLPAIKAFEAVLELAPDDNEVLSRLGVLYARNKPTWPQAITTLTEALKKDSDNLTLRKLLADLYYWMGEYPSAELNYLALLTTQPENSEVLLSLAQVLTWQQRGTEAIPLFAKAQLLNAKFTETAQYARALATFQTDDYKAAEQVYLQLVNNFPKVAKYRTELKKVRESLAKAQSAEAESIASTTTTLPTETTTVATDEPSSAAEIVESESPTSTVTRSATAETKLVAKENQSKTATNAEKIGAEKTKDAKANNNKTIKDPLVLAEDLMKKGWVLGALEAYQKALAKEPQNLRARKGLALAEEKQGRAPQAIKAFEAVLELDPNDTDSLGRVGILYARSKKTWPQAISALTSALKNDSDNFMLRKLLADVYNWAGEYPDAERNYLTLLQVQPENPDVTLSLAQVMTWQQRGGEALPLFAKAQRLNAKFNETAQYARSLAIFQAEDYATAERAYLQLTKDFPKVDKYRVELEKVREAIVTLPQRHLDEQLNIARTDFSSGDYERAFSAFNRVLVDTEFRELLAKKENAAKIRLEYADLLASRPDRIRDAINQLDLIEEQTSEVALKREQFMDRLFDERLNIARADFNNGNYDRAFAEFGRVLAERDNPTLRLEYADILSSRPDRIKDALNQLDLIRPQTAELDLKRARLLTRLPETRSKAVQLYLRLRALNPEDVEIKRELIKVLGWIELDETVVLVAAELVAHDPDAKSLRLPVIRYYMQIGRPEPTIALLQVIAGESPQEVEPHLLLARAYFLTNRKTDSRREYETVLQLDMSNAEANEQVGWFTLQSGDPQRALTRFESAIELSPQALTPKIGRINALLALREHVAAEQQLRQITAKDDPLVEDVRARIKEGLAGVNVEMQ
jgi:tetratricopeptide (TPR) repeat protein